MICCWLSICIFPLVNQRRSVVDLDGLELMIKYQLVDTKHKTFYSMQARPISYLHVNIAAASGTGWLGGELFMDCFPISRHGGLLHIHDDDVQLGSCTVHQQYL
ncbi:hypothetical protein EDD15DRAFT_1447491 [Pisolithus albus]|nr:hypothetical protein EDD15DRAFT_1447491 [Pisolithus albus]